MPLTRSVPFVFTNFCLWNKKARYSFGEVWWCANPHCAQICQDTSRTGVGACTQFWNSVWFSLTCSYTYSLLSTCLNLQIQKELNFTLKFKSEYEYNFLRLDCIIFVPYISLMLVGKYHIGKTYWLSWCEVRYGIDMEIQHFIFKVLGQFFLIKCQNS